MDPAAGPDPATSLEAVYREERGRLLATLVRQLRDLDLAEEVASEAVEAALVRWPVDGVPTRPAAWLLTVARRRAIDRLRRDRALAARLALLAVDAERAEPVGGVLDGSVLDGSDPDGSGVPDERLRLFFTCCHPALDLPSRTALTLRCLGGLETPEVARAFLVSPATMTQRIVRAKRRIKQAGVPYRVPSAAELPERLPGVLQVLHLLFTEGYAATSGPDLVRAGVSAEAIRLTRVLRRLLPAEREVTGLLALMLLVEARRPARTGPDGDLVLLEDQDRGRWDRDLVEEGRGLVAAALTAGPAGRPGVRPGPYAVQAAIAAVLDDAPDVASTDWRQIVALYDLLLELTPSPVVALNRAVAVAMVHGPAAGLRLLDALGAGGIGGAGALADHHLYHAARADLLRRLGRRDEALTAYRQALACVGNEPERRFLERRIAELGGPHMSSPPFTPQT